MLCLRHGSQVVWTLRKKLYHLHATLALGKIE